MRVYRTEHETFFTVLPNGMLQDKSLSFTARGILGYLLSLEDGYKIDVRKLADDNPGVGRKGITNAVDELIAAGYYVRVTNRDDGGNLRTSSAVYDLRQTDSRMPGTGQPGSGQAGTNPFKETPVKETSPLPPTVSAPESDAQAGGDGTEDLSSTKDKQAACAPLVARIGRMQPRLTIGLAEMGKVLPLMAEWRERGASDDQIIHAVTGWVPDEIRTAVGFVRSQLSKKMPPALPVKPVTVLTPLVECPECGKPGRTAGVCADCQPASNDNPGAVEDAASRTAADLRRSMGWRKAS
jgi:hypothetical protein